MFILTSDRNSFENEAVSITKMLILKYKRCLCNTAKKMSKYNFYMYFGFTVMIRNYHIHRCFVVPVVWQHLLRLNLLIRSIHCVETFLSKPFISAKHQ